ncbi:MAG: tetratricopeptide repeat protein [Scytonema sp. PMC 1069.18]|nr:tetratricopeptide repeat protein [Scytonema sp. PMC 1069.18]MEC4880831.1 tetratricopeptide repeat protein [Scytonema sp. PMC 1070.18]
MNSQRQQAYFNLIQSLLSYPSGQEPQILSANHDLLDIGLLQAMKTLVQVFSQRGSEKAATLANRLTYLVNQLEKALNSDIIASQESNKRKVTAEDSQAVNFLMKVLEAMQYSNGNPEVVYPLLAANTNKLDNIFTKNLQHWMTSFIKQAKADVAKSTAEIIGNFGTLIAQFPLSDKANNMEIAIACYETIIQVYTREAFPQEWAMTQLNLGNVYRERIKGDKADNIESAISYFQAALQVLTRQALPQQWAITQISLGAAYSERIKENTSENIESAISYFQAALQILTRQVFPQQWAIAQINLANAYNKRIEEDKAENIENAISYFQAALQVLTRLSSPQEWAMTQMNLGDTYWYRINGDKSDNIENAIKAYQAALKIITLQAFPQEWAKTQMNLGYAYYDRINGDKYDNIENARKSFQAALKVLTREAFPQEWANIQNKLGDAYWRRIKGDKAQNIEDAIRAFQAALEIINRQASPQDWARTQMNLGFAYINRIKGDKAENIEDAIKALQAALQVRTRQASPQDWAKTQINLGLAYTERINGDKAQNVENAISSHQAALEVLNRQASPQDWAMIQHNLGGAYFHRINGDKAQNIEDAIKAFRAALQIHSREASPQEWASTQMNLGAAYLHRINGDKAQNIEDAIKALQAALQVRTRQASPQDWAMAQNNLGLAYTDRINGDKADNIENAIKAFQAALEVAQSREASPFNWAVMQHNLGNAYVSISKIKPHETYYVENAINAYKAALQVRTRQASPEYWAMTQVSLGNAYFFRRIKGDISETENIEDAIRAFQAALKVYTRQAFPQQWAMAQNNLGLAYKARKKGDEHENIKNAIAALEAALQVRTREAFPYEHTETLFNLGITYQYIVMFNFAYTTYKSTIETLELLRGSIISGEESKRKQAEQFNEVYIRMVEVCLELEDWVNSPFVQRSSLPLDTLAEAIEYVERSKTRNLVELILNRDLKTIFPPETATQLEQLQDEIATIQYQIQNGIGENLTDLAKRLENLWQRRQELQDKYLPIGSGFKVDQFQSSLDEETAIIEWYITGAYVEVETFIITRNSLQRLNVSQPNDNMGALNDWKNEYIRAYDEYRRDKNKTEWKDNLTSRLIRLAEILQIEDILQLIPKTCTRIILIPHRYLHLFPLHLLPLANGKLLCERYPKGVSYAPSCQLLQQIQKRERPDFTSIFAIQNPTKDLNYADLEVDIILSLFSSPQRLSYEEATKDTLLQKLLQLKEANYLHFSCHGSFNSNFPQNSCLKLAESLDENGELDLSKCLTLSNLFERDFKLDNCRLVVLSACETGLIDSKNTSDEYIGLPSGFLYAGSISVVSSLWTVDDVSTALLIIKFYQNIKAGLTVAVALNQAQIWLRDVTKVELERWIEENQLPLSPAVKMNLRRRFHKLPNDAQPFQSPFYWAAFCAIGQ